MPEATDSSLYELARSALLEITRDDTLGEPRDIVTAEDGTKTVRFENTLPGYPGWLWTVGVAQVEGEEPTVLETELLPGETSLLAPDWVPWEERLAEYEAAQEHHDGAEDDSEGDDDSDDDDSDDDDDDDLDDDDDSDDVDDDSDEYADVSEEDILDDSDDEQLDVDAAGEEPEAPHRD
ncbi:DUF3027 domain-containing protein [Frondihabitans cladoniiphilus]|uniref:DUF3027 family protein n=1 Tax=Frondihabitans cladoniiphilus TaxID=715785 RepID=A0ABP8VW66_9MICO